MALSKKHWTKILLPYLAVVILLMAIFRTALTVPFVFHNDYFLLTDKFSCCMEHPESKHLIRIGRPLGSLLLNVQSLFLHSLGQAAMNRLLAICVTGLSVMLLAVFLRRLRMNWLLAVGISFGIFILPGNQLNVIWISNFVPGVLNVALTLVAAFFIERVDPRNLTRWKSLDRVSLQNLGLCFGTLTLTLMIYPPTTMFFLVPTLTLVLFSPLETWKETRLRVARNVLALIVTIGTYFVISRVILSIKYPAYQLGAYQFRMAEDWLGKIQYFFKDVSYLVFNLWNTPPTSVIVLGVCVVILGAASALLIHLVFFRRIMLANILQLSGAACFLCLMSCLPNLVAAANVLGYRMFVPYSAMAGLLFFWSLTRLAYLLPQKFRSGVSVLFIGVVLFGASTLASANVNAVVANANLELDFVQSQVRQQLKDADDRYVLVFVARPANHTTFTDQPLAYDFRFMATNYSMIGNIFSLTLKELGDYRRVRVVVTTSEALHKLRLKPSRLILVDMNELVPPSVRGTIPPYDRSVLTGLSAEYWDMERPAYLHAYNGYSLFYAAGFFYGIPEAGRTFSIEKFRNHEYHEGFVTADYEELLRRINAALPSRLPYLVEKGFRGFYIIFLDGRYFGIPQDEYKGFVVGESTQEVKEAIVRCYSSRQEPCLVWSEKPILSRKR